MQGAPNAQIILNVSLSDEILKSEIFALSAPLRLKNSRNVGLLGTNFIFFLPQRRRERKERKVESSRKATCNVQLFLTAKAQREQRAN